MPSGADRQKRGGGGEANGPAAGTMAQLAGRLRGGSLDSLEVWRTAFLAPSFFPSNSGLSAREFPPEWMPANLNGHLPVFQGRPPLPGSHCSSHCIHAVQVHTLPRSYRHDPPWPRSVGANLSICQRPTLDASRNAVGCCKVPDRPFTIGVVLASKASIDAPLHHCITAIDGESSTVLWKPRNGMNHGDTGPPAPSRCTVTSITVHVQPGCIREFFFL